MADFSANEWLIGYLLSQKKLTAEALATFHPSVCNRLDRNTSGLLLCGKSLLGTQKLTGLIRNRQIHKYYRLFLLGEVKEKQILTGYLLKDTKKNQVKILTKPAEGADEIKTGIEPLACLEIPGIGTDKAVTVCAAVELGRRISRQHVKEAAPDFSTPQAIAGYVMEDLRFLPQEQFGAVYLSTKNQLIAYRTLTIGTINASLAKSREVFRYALRYNAAAVVLVHNHPSGNPEPSHEDIVVTQRIADAGQIMEIPVLDHIIIGDGTFVSLCERGYV